MDYFDLHVHPSLKGSLTREPDKYNAWKWVGIYPWGIGQLNRLKQVFNSQANLTQLQNGTVFSVVALVAMEKAFAGTYILQKIIASRIASPLSRRLLIEIVRGEKLIFPCSKKI